MWQMIYIARSVIDKKEKIHTKRIFRNHQIAVLTTSVTYNSARCTKDSSVNCKGIFIFDQISTE